MNYFDDDFLEIGLKFEKKYYIKKGRIGEAASKLFSAKDYVNFAIKYIKKI